MAWKPDYVTVEDMKRELRIDDVLDDVTIQVKVTAASTAIDDHCGRQFGKVDDPQVRSYTAYADATRGVWVLPIDDLMDVTGMQVDVAGTALTAPGWTLEPRNALADGEPYTRLVFTDLAEAYPCGLAGEVEITALWGWDAVPTGVRNACLLQASRFLSRRDSPYGVAGSPEVGSELRLLARVDPDVAVSLRGFRRRKAIA